MATRIYFPGRIVASRFPVQYGFSAADLTRLQIECNINALELENPELSFEQAMRYLDVQLAREDGELSNDEARDEASWASGGLDIW